MKIALIGATGFVGSYILQEAIERGYLVTAISRDTKKLPTHKNIAPVAVDVADVDKLADILKGHDAVVMSYSGGLQGDPYAQHINGFRSILAATQKSGIKRFLMVGGAGTLEIKPGLQLVDTPDFPAAWKGGASAARDAYNILKTTDLDWTSFSPAAEISPGKRTGKYQVGGSGFLTNAQGESKISNQDFAVALINELEKPAHVRQLFTVAY